MIPDIYEPAGNQLPAGSVKNKVLSFDFQWYNLMYLLITDNK
ncbi:MAG: hypothetical protein K0S33_2867 [Bacteroidetes bacterium]|jgi:hypothetical protein|nr:hypothetical protein [Bacteroidota bacterium]